MQQEHKVVSWVGLGQGFFCFLQYRVQSKMKVETKWYLHAWCPGKKKQRAEQDCFELGVQGGLGELPLGVLDRTLGLKLPRKTPI